MSDTTTPTSLSPEQLKAEQYKRFKHFAALTFIVGAPVLIALPPRRLNLYSISLSAAFVLSANQLTIERKNRSILSYMNPIEALNSLPSQRARETHERHEREKARQLEEIERTQGVEAKRRELERRQSLIDKVWMGGEEEGWKERRLKEEQERIAAGEGYGSMIMDQIWEVWTWGKKRKEDASEGEEDKEGKDSRES